MRRTLLAVAASAVVLLAACGSDEKSAASYLGKPQDGMSYEERPARETRLFKSAFGEGDDAPVDFAARAVRRKGTYVAVLLIARFGEERDMDDARADYLRAIHAQAPSKIEVAGKEASIVTGDPGTVFVVDRDGRTLMVSTGHDRAAVLAAARPIVR